MSVGAFSEAAFLIRDQSNSLILRLRSVVDVRSVLVSLCSGIPDLRAISARLISRAIGPDVFPVPGASPTLIGYVRQTITTLRTLLGEIPASARHPATVVSREVT